MSVAAAYRPELHSWCETRPVATDRDYFKRLTWNWSLNKGEEEEEKWEEQEEGGREVGGAGEEEK